MLEKSGRDFFSSKVKKGKNSPVFHSAQKVRVGLYPGETGDKLKKGHFYCRESPDGISPRETGDKLKKGPVWHSESSGGI